MTRPSSFTQEIADLICERIADGESLRSICAEEEMPDKSTVFRWLEALPDFATKYARAREFQADSMADDIVDIADTPQIGVKTKTNEKGEVETTEGDMIEHRKLRIAARQWTAEKLRPKKYGSRTNMALSDPDGNALPVPVLNLRIGG